MAFMDYLLVLLRRGRAFLFIPLPLFAESDERGLFISDKRVFQEGVVALSCEDKMVQNLDSENLSCFN